MKYLKIESKFNTYAYNGLTILLVAIIVIIISDSAKHALINGGHIGEFICGQIHVIGAQFASNGFSIGN